jgi:hypothetical protein
MDSSSEKQETMSPPEKPGTPGAGARGPHGAYRRVLRHPLVTNLLSAVFATALTLLIVLPEEKKPPPPVERPNPTIPAKRGDLDAMGLPRILKVLGSKKSYVLRDGVAHSITTGDEFTCNAEYLPVEFNVTERRWQEIVDHSSNEAAICPLGPPPFLRPTIIRDRYILIQRDGNGSSSPRRIWQLRAGRLFPVRLTGPTFACLARTELVWDFVSPEEVRNFRRFHQRVGCH